MAVGAGGRLCISGTRYVQHSGAAVATDACQRMRAELVTAAAHVCWLRPVHRPAQLPAAASGIVCSRLCKADMCAVLRWCVCLQRFFSATLQNFATQSLLMAVGVGARKALAASAAINWMLKDGMNRLVRMGVATQFGDSFDSDLKVGEAQRSKLDE